MAQLLKDGKGFASTILRITARVELNNSHPLQQLTEPGLPAYFSIWV